MPLPSSIVGLRTPADDHDVDVRWTMAYAAALGDLSPRYLDTTRDGGVVAHPLFPVCPEWPTVLATRRLGPLADTLTTDEARRGVHAVHDLTVGRLIRPGDVLRTHAEVTGVERRSPGAFQTIVLTTVDAGGEVVARTVQGALFLGVAVDGEDRPAPTPDPLPDGGDRPTVTVEIPIGGGAAHTYTDCARIWNPIHTDPVVARAAGLPAIILHGTATLAHAVTVAVDHLAGGDPARVRRIRGRFAAMVEPGSTITVRLFEEGRFEVLNAEGRPAVRDGHVALHPR